VEVLFLNRKEVALTIRIAITETHGNMNPAMELELAVIDVDVDAVLELAEVVAGPVEDELAVDVVVTEMLVEVLSVLIVVVEEADDVSVLVDVVLELLVVLDEVADVVVTCATESVNVPELPSLSPSPE
jgi:hypothetical protein